MEFDVYFYEAFAEERDELLRRIPAGLRAGFSSATLQASGHPRPPAPLISIRTQSALPEDWHPPVTGLLARTTGDDHLRRLLQRRNRPALATIPEYCSRAVAEQAALLWMALLRALPAQWTQWHAFNRDGLTGGEAAGRELLVVGVGRIGHEVVKIGRGLEMRVRGVDPVRRHADVEYAPFDAGLRTADVLVCCMNLHEANRDFFRYETLLRARPGALLVNVARGELVRTRDLARLLDEKILGGIALDVFEDEPILADALRDRADTPEAGELRRLAGRPGVLLTPHNAFNTREALARKCEYSIRQILHFRQHGVFLPPAL